MYTPLDLPLLARLRERILYSAGPIGSTLLSYNLTREAFVAFPGTDREEEHDGCPEFEAAPACRPAQPFSMAVYSLHGHHH
jgi:5-methyltetrahydrofolate--homocysteine methyltransferase